jgi:hypothetical protein
MATRRWFSASHGQPAFSAENGPGEKYSGRATIHGKPRNISRRSAISPTSWPASEEYFLLRWITSF